jgi:hypothetical protein
MASGLMWVERGLHPLRGHPGIAKLIEALKTPEGGGAGLFLSEPQKGMRKGEDWISNEVSGARGATLYTLIRTANARVSTPTHTAQTSSNAFDQDEAALHRVSPQSCLTCGHPDQQSLQPKETLAGRDFRGIIFT